MTFKQWVTKHKLQNYTGRNPESEFNRIDYLVEYLGEINTDNDVWAKNITWAIYVISKVTNA